MTVKFAKASNQSLSAPDNDSFTIPNADHVVGFVLGFDGTSGSTDPQYVLSTGTYGEAGSFNLTLQRPGSDWPNRLALYLGTNTVSPVLTTTTALAAGEIWMYFIQRTGTTYNAFRVPILVTAPSSGAPVVAQGSAAVSTEFNGLRGLTIGGRADKNSTRAFDQSIGRAFLLEGNLTPLEMARLAHGEDLITQLGKTPKWYVKLETISDIADRGPSANVFTVSSSSPTTSAAQPQFGYTGGTVPQPDPNAVTVNEAHNLRPFQSDGTRATVPLSGSYTGTTPTSIEARLAPDGQTETAWQVLTSVSIGSGAWAGAISAPDGGPYAYEVRSKSGSTVLATSTRTTSKFLVGDLWAVIGSSGGSRLFTSDSGTGYMAAANTRTLSGSGTPAWSLMGTTGAATEMAADLAGKAGKPIGMLNYGVSGSSLAQWLVTSGSQWQAFLTGLAAAGGKLKAVYITVGSNDAGNSAITSSASHLANMQTLVDNVCAATGQPNLPVVWVGSNRRPPLTATQANRLRMAENSIGEYPNVLHVQTLDFEINSDNIHLSAGPLGYAAAGKRSTFYGGRMVYDGVDSKTLRGPKITGFQFSGADVLVNIVQRNGTNLAPTSGATGFALSDASGTPSFTTTRVSATQYRLTANRTLVAPVVATYGSGASPDVTSPLYDNSSHALPATVETDMQVTDAGVPDTTAPTMVGDIAITSVTETGATISWQAATDDVAVTGYEYSINGGTSYINVNGLRTAALSGLTQNTTYPLRVRAYDAAGNRASPLPANLVTTATPADTTVPALTGSVTAASVTANSATISWPAATDNVAVTGYEYSINGGTSYVNAGTARTASLALLTASTTYPLRVRAYDAAGNRSAAITGSLTTLAASPTPVGFVPSVSRTVRILAGRNAYDVGPFWAASGANSPVGSKDPNSTIDVYFDWTAWLADIGNAKLSSVDFVLSAGAQSVAGIPTDIGGTVFVSGGTSDQSISITCRITTATTPARVEDRTVVLQIKEQ